jgi:hypothetical protein
MIVPLHCPLGPTAAPVGSVFAYTVHVIAGGVNAGSEAWVLRVPEATKGHMFQILPESEGSRVAVSFATLSSVGSGDVMGTFSAKDADYGVASSLLNAPLEDLRLSPWEPFGDGS